MDPQTQHALNAINQRFYASQAASFSDTRNHPWPGWEPLVSHLTPRDHGSGHRHASVLDVGCGNGRFLDYLSRRWRVPFRYLGCDASEALLAIARARHAERPHTDLVVCDLVDREPDDALPAGLFDLAVLFGVMHHIPSFERRRAALLAMGRRLAPGGILALTFWQFAAQARFDGRILPWEQYNEKASEPVALDQLEPGDHLLRWGAGDAPPRYCHFVDDGERSRLLAGLPLEPIDRYRADGKSQDLNDYILLRQPREG